MARKGRVQTLMRMIRSGVIRIGAILRGAKPVIGAAGVTAQPATVPARPVRTARRLVSEKADMAHP